MNNDINSEYLVLLLKDLVVLPGQEVKIELLNEGSKQLINLTNNNNINKILVVAPLQTKEIDPNTDDLPKVGVVALLKSTIELSNGNIRVTLKGQKRVVVDKYFYLSTDDILRASTTVINLPNINELDEKALIRKLKTSLKKVIKINKSLSNTIVSALDRINDIARITDIVTSFLPFNTDKKLEYMQMINPLARAKALLVDIEEEIKILKLEEEIEDSIQRKLGDKEREYYLREKLNEIKLELGESSLKDLEANKYLNLLKSLKLNESVNKKIINEIEKYRLASEDSPEVSVIRNYLETVLSLPWNKTSKERKDADKVFEKLEINHFGLTEIKERIVEYIELKNISSKVDNPVICLVGPPGVGKTTIAMSIAASLNRKFIKIAVGGLNDSIELIGSRRTYLGANPGKIIEGIKKCGTNNPVILFDEVDKMVKDYKGDPASILLEVLDPVQNKNFTDNYIEESFDLSNALFILTANDISDIPYALRDRLEIMELNGYTIYEKISIAKKYIIPRIISEYNLINTKIKVSDEMLSYIITTYTKEAGVRDLSRYLYKLMRKAIIQKISNITIKNIASLLGQEKYNIDEIASLNNLGTTNALAYTNIGGMVTKIETVKYKGSGEVATTGCLGLILEETIKVALSYLKNYHKVDFKNQDIHLHFLDASSKKDGPSAGVSIITSLLSLYLGKSVDSKTAFTGEITLNGNILKVGGVKEKVIAAINAGITTIYLPQSNINDIVEIPNKYLNQVNIKFVKSYKEIYSEIF